MFISILQDSELSENIDLQQLIQQVDEEDIHHLDEEYTHFESLFPPLDTGMEDQMNIETSAWFVNETSSDTALIKQCMESVLTVLEPYPVLDQLVDNSCAKNSSVSIANESCLVQSSILSEGCLDHNIILSENAAATEPVSLSSADILSTTECCKSFTELQSVNASTSIDLLTLQETNPCDTLIKSGIGIEQPSDLDINDESLMEHHSQVKENLQLSMHISRNSASTVNDPVTSESNENRPVSESSNSLRNTADNSRSNVFCLSGDILHSTASTTAEKTPSRIKEATQSLGFVQFKPPQSITRHPTPATGKDDDLMKLREILDDIMLKTDHLHPDDRISNKILFAPDQKIGQNLLKLIEGSNRYQVFLPEFPCLHLRKSKITNLCTAYKDAGIIHILRYMRDDDTQEWSKLISAEDINKASRYIRRLSLAFHVAFMSKFLTTLEREKRLTAERDLKQGTILDITNKYQKEYASFLQEGISRNATFALHHDIMQHCDEISAITFAERLGGQVGYDLLLGSVKSSLPFSFMNGAVSYAPYCTQMLRVHYESGHFYQQMKAALFSTPHKSSNFNFGLDCQREMDHRDVMKAFRSGSSEAAVLPRMALIDTYNDILNSPLRKDGNDTIQETSNDFLGLELNETDKIYILRVAALIIRQGGLNTCLATTPINVYGRNREELPGSILDRNTADVGIYLIQRYLAASRTCGMTMANLPDISSLNGPKEYINRVKAAKGITVKRVTKAMTKSRAKSEREIKEEQRKKLVAKQKKTTDGLSSDMNMC